MQNSIKTAKIFNALCDKTRVDIINLLTVSEKCACKISEELNIAQSKLAYHMKILCESGLIESSYIGKWTYYKINKDGFEIAINILKEIRNDTKDISN